MMSHRIVRQLGWVLWLIDAALIVAGIILVTQVSGSEQNGGLLGNYSLVTAFFAFPTMGALIIWQRPGTLLDGYSAPSAWVRRLPRSPRDSCSTRLPNILTQASSWGWLMCWAILSGQ